MGLLINLDNYRPAEPIYGPEPRFETKIIELFPEEAS